MPEYGPEVILERPAFVHPSAQIYGRVRVGPEASIWPNVVIRAEMYEVEIGSYVNVQDLVMIHVGDGCGTRIGAYSSITHHAVVHGARIGENCLIGINATLMDGSVIGDNCIVAGGAFVTQGTVIPDNSVVMGVPGKVVRTNNNWVANRYNAAIYHWNARAYARGDHRGWAAPEFADFAAVERARIEAEFEAAAGGG